jgi:hypothetical protein
MDPIPRGLDVHSRVAFQFQPDRAAALEGALWEQAPQLRQERRERQIGSRGQSSRPERLGELVPAGHSIAVGDEICEEETPLPAGQIPVDPPTSHSSRETPAELNPRALRLWLHIGHRPKLAPKAGVRIWPA